MVHTQIYNIVEQDYPTFSFPFSITLHSKMHIKYSVLLSSVNLTCSMSVRSMKHNSLGYFIKGWILAQNCTFSNKKSDFAHIANSIKNKIILLTHVLINVRSSIIRENS